VSIALHSLTAYQEDPQERSFPVSACCPWGRKAVSTDDADRGVRKSLGTVYKALDALKGQNSSVQATHSNQVHYLSFQTITFFVAGRLFSSNFTSSLHQLRHVIHKHYFKMRFSTIIATMLSMAVVAIAAPIASEGTSDTTTQAQWWT
jgi:hypothetical protein